MSGAQWGLVGGIAGGLLGTAGGVIGTYFSIRNTRTVEERAFMVRLSASIWVMGLALIAVLVLGLTGVIPQAVYWTAWIAFMVALGPAIAFGNRRLARLREEGTPLESSP